MFDSDSAHLFRPYLLAGESTLWAGRPKQGLALSSRDAYLIPFSLMWGGFALFWNLSVWTGMKTADDWFFKLWGLPFLAVGFYFVLGRFFHDASIRRKLHYAVTDQRVLILRDSRSSKLTSREIRSLPMLELTENRDGTGTIAFDTDDSLWTRNQGFGGWTPSSTPRAQFFRIDNPRRVYELIRDHAHS